MRKQHSGCKGWQGWAGRQCLERYFESQRSCPAEWEGGSEWASGGRSRAEIYQLVTDDTDELGCACPPPWTWYGSKSPHSSEQLQFYPTSVTHVSSLAPKLLTEIHNHKERSGSPSQDTFAVTVSLWPWSCHSVLSNLGLRTLEHWGTNSQSERRKVCTLREGPYLLCQRRWEVSDYWGWRGVPGRLHDSFLCVACGTNKFGDWEFTKNVR